MPLDVSTRSTAHHGDPPSKRLGSIDPGVPTPRGAEGAAVRTILVAEDDNNTRRALQHYLSRFGYHVIEAASVTSSLEAAFSDAG